MSPQSEHNPEKPQVQGTTLFDRTLQNRDGNIMIAQMPDSDEATLAS